MGGPPNRTVSTGGVSFQVCARDDGFWEAFESGGWEPWTVRVLRERLVPGSRYVDIGSWVGPMVLLAAAAGAVVEAFEPDPAAFAELQANLDANPELARNVTAHATALGAAAGTRTLFFHAAPGDTMSSLAHTATTDAGSVRVSVESVRHWLDRPVFDADLIKVDIEGGEYELLTAVRSYLARRRPDLLLSIHAYQLAGRSDRIAARGVPRKVASHGVVLRERLRIRWLRRIYAHAYRATGNDWRAIDGKTWRRLLHVPANYELFFTDRQL